MGWFLRVLSALLASRLIAAVQEPPPPDAPPNPAPAPAPGPVAPAAPVPAPAPGPPMIGAPAAASGFLGLGQFPYGGVLLPSPAQDLAMLEVGGPLPADDPRVASAAALLSQLTAVYVEDAPRIAALTIRVVREVRAANQAASPLEMMVGATQWKRAPGMRGNVPRTFEEFARLYRQWRIVGGKDHAMALSQMQPPAPSPAPAP